MSSTTRRWARGRIIAMAVIGTASIFAPKQASAWGHTGHVEIGRIAAQALPGEIRRLLRTPDPVTAISEWNAELDLSKAAGQTHDLERDPGHYIDIDDNGLVMGILPFDTMPISRRDYDTALRPGGQTQYGSGYLYYSLIDGWQQVRKDFAWVRALSAGLKTASNRADRAFFKDQLGLRRALLLRNIGVWGHYVADGSQPMHVSVHFNGWGNYPNPNHYTNEPIHAPFEGSFVRDFVRVSAIRTAMPSYRDCKCAIEQRVHDYLLATLAKIDRTYSLAGSSANYTRKTSAAVDFVTQRLAAGAAEMRDMAIDAWKSSASSTVGYPPISVADIESGKVKVTRRSFWND